MSSVPALLLTKLAGELLWMGGSWRRKEEEKQALSRGRREGLGEGPTEMWITAYFSVCVFATEKAETQTDVMW